VTANTSSVLDRIACPSSSYASALNRWETSAMVPAASPPPRLNAAPQNGPANPTPAMAEPPRATPTIATSAALLDMRATPVTMRGHASSEDRRARSSETRPRRASASPISRSRRLNGFGTTSGSWSERDRQKRTHFGTKHRHGAGPVRPPRGG